MFKAIVISLVVGALATTSAEYFFHYNLLDLAIDKVLAVYRALRGK